MKNVLVLGATGMLGSMVYHYGKTNTGFNVIGSSRKPIEGLIQFNINDGIPVLRKNLSGVEYIINCIGITKPYCHDTDMKEVANAVRINALFPHDLAVMAEKEGINVIQIATDCVYSGSKGAYIESDVHDALDAYGKTKSLGEVRSKRFLNIRCSIVGPEIFNKTFLLEWFLKQPPGSSVNGFTHHLWNGITTLQFAELCFRIISDNCFQSIVDTCGLHHFAPNTTVNKYELLCIFNDVFDRKLVINKKSESGNRVDRTLATEYSIFSGLYPSGPMESAVKNLKNYIDKHNFYTFFTS